MLLHEDTFHSYIFWLVEMGLSAGSLKKYESVVDCKIVWLCLGA